MAADTLSLRERIDARLVAAGFNPTSRGEILTQVLPVVEQALAEKDAQIATLQAVVADCVRETHEWPLIEQRKLSIRALRAKVEEQAQQIRDAEDRQLERGAQLSELHAALAEKDAQIAALQAKYLAVIREVETPLPPDGADYE